MRLELSRRAQADLDDIRDYSVERFGVVRAIAYLDAIEDAFRLLLRFPEMGGMHLALTLGTRSVGCEQHRVYYEVDGDCVRIIRILHRAMDVERQV